MIQRDLHGQTAYTLATPILRGDYAPDSILPREAELMLAFGVSRTVLREALRTLTSKGLIESRPKVGTRVRSREAWNLLNAELLDWYSQVAPPLAFAMKLQEMREMVEPYAAGLAARADAGHVRGDRARARGDVRGAACGRMGARRSALSPGRAGGRRQRVADVTRRADCPHAGGAAASEREARRRVQRLAGRTHARGGCDPRATRWRRCSAPRASGSSASRVRRLACGGRDQPAGFGSAGFGAVAALGGWAPASAASVCQPRPRLFCSDT